MNTRKQIEGQEKELRRVNQRLNEKRMDVPWWFGMRIQCTGNKMRKDGIE